MVYFSPPWNSSFPHLPADGRNVVEIGLASNYEIGEEVPNACYET